MPIAVTTSVGDKPAGNLIPLIAVLMSSAVAKFSMARVTAICVGKPAVNFATSPCCTYFSASAVVSVMPRARAASFTSPTSNLLLSAKVITAATEAALDGKPTNWVRSTFTGLKSCWRKISATEDSFKYELSATAFALVNKSPIAILSVPSKDT